MLRCLSFTWFRRHTKKAKTGSPHQWDTNQVGTWEQGKQDVRAEQDDRERTGRISEQSSKNTSLTCVLAAHVTSKIRVHLLVHAMWQHARDVEMMTLQILDATIRVETRPRYPALLCSDVDHKVN